MRPTFAAGVIWGIVSVALASAAAAADSGWTATVITGSISPKQEQAARPSSTLPPAGRLRDASVPPVEEKPAQPSTAPVKAAGERPRNAEARPAQQYCISIANAAADARVAWQKKTIADIEQELDKRVAKLDAKIVEYQQWLARRDDFSKRAQEQLVGIFARMRPDAAAPQLAAGDEETAAAVLSKLDTRIASAILSEMEPNQAARLTAIMVGAAKVAPDKTVRAAPDGKRS